MTEIAQDSSLTTLINTFTTTPDTQDRVLEILIETTEKEVSGLPGFVSANFHKSADGTRIVNYAQWATEEDWKAMLANPAAAAHIAEVLKLATADFNLYEVVATISPAK